MTRPSLFGYVSNRAELDKASSELFSLIASGAIKADVSANQIFGLSEAQKANSALENHQTHGSCLLIPGR